MRRAAPRPAGGGPAPTTVGEAEPATLLARVQSAWPAAVGDAMAAEAEPSSEREGVVTVRCTSSLWASELELMGPDLASSLNAALGSEDPSSPVSGAPLCDGRVTRETIVAAPFLRICGDFVAELSLFPAPRPASL